MMEKYFSVFSDEELKFYQERFINSLSQYKPYMFLSEEKRNRIELERNERIELERNRIELERNRIELERNERIELENERLYKIVEIKERNKIAVKKYRDNNRKKIRQKHKLTLNKDVPKINIRKYMKKFNMKYKKCEKL